MTTRKKILVVVTALALAAILSSAPAARAAAPTLALASSSDGDSVSLTVTGGANASVVFYYTKIGSGLQLNALGKTDASGNFSTILSTAAYGLGGNALIYVTVGGQKSNEAAWPSQAAAGVLSLSQTSVVLPLGKSAALTAYNNGSNYIYLSSNSNPPVANANIDGNTITLKALNFGSTIVMVCAGTGAPSCASAYVTVQNTGGQALAFSQNNPTVAAGQNVAITISGGSGAYVLLNNANATAVQASLSGSTVTLSTANTSGSSAITVCSSDMSSCGMINAVIGNVSSSGITFSQINPAMNIGQSLSLTISGGAGGNYSVFSNTNTGAVTAGVSGNNLRLTANSGGVATITVCSAMGNCAPLAATVNYNTATSGGSIALSQNNLWLLPGQAASVTVSGGSMPYSVAGYSADILKASFTNNVLTITGVGAGSASVNVCSAGGGCTILSVLITGANVNINTTTVTPAVPATPVAPAPAPAPAPAAPAVAAPVAPVAAAGQVAGKKISTASAVKAAAKYKFSKTLAFGAKGDLVKELQKRLMAEKFYKGAIDGKFLTTTVAAVKKYQKSKGIKQTGNLGVLTMAALNK